MYNETRTQENLQENPEEPSGSVFRLLDLLFQTLLKLVLVLVLVVRCRSVAGVTSQHLSVAHSFTI